ncbi:MAG TPA: LLM class flavin-dependent oxidoreductase [Acidimicrobiales bacterium]|jgi:alkanesulfonate monooxygenase SsuD/methylene tetrahydromethanopterin reductase-like flavin-dependent oxidoreductase (luciferase family)
MKVGITVPQFSDDPAPAIEVARRADAADVDGVFVFDHLWPLGQPERPALYSLPLLGALAAETGSVTLGPLVTRVSVLPNPVLVHALVTLHRMLGDRFVAGLGTGDSANRAENEGYGLGFGSVGERVADVRDCCRQLRAAGVRTWVGGKSPAVRRTAAEEADGWNGWGWCADPVTFAAAAADITSLAPTLELTWGGQVLIGRTPETAAAKLARLGERQGLVHGTVDDLGAHLEALAAAGASWAICAPLDVGTDPESVELIAEAAALAR